MGSLRATALYHFLLLACLYEKCASTQDNSNEESLLENNEDIYRQYQLLNKVMKRQTKGSCSCTCETKPVVKYVEDETDAKHSERQNKSSGSSKTGSHAPTILRTGGLSVGSQNPLWSLSAHKDTPEVDGESQLKEEYSEVDSEQSHGQNDYDGNLADNRNSDIGWGHGSRFPWLHLPNEMCFRKRCSSNLDCCRKFNLCDRSASVCVDCWYGSTCTSEAQCCEKYPYCEMLDGGALSSSAVGRCVDAL